MRLLMRGVWQIGLSYVFFSQHLGDLGDLTPGSWRRVGARFAEPETVTYE